jgi:tRNA threonylcarbamoyladenosine biosynthesis protein TsaE
MGNGMQPAGAKGVRWLEWSGKIFSILYALSYFAYRHRKKLLQPIAIHQWLTSSAEETHTLGMHLGQLANSGDFVACCGALGAGKTTFIQGFAQGLAVGAEAYVRSPTFMLAHQYNGRLPLYHFDFYRLSYLSEIQDIGFTDYLNAGGVVIVEWADKFPEILPIRRLDVAIKVTSLSTRSIQCTAYDISYVRYCTSFIKDCTPR